LGDGDVERVRVERQAAPAARLIVDANESWNEARVRDYVPMLVELRVALIEQPLPVAWQPDIVDLDGPLRLALDRGAGPRYEGSTIRPADPKLWGGPG